MLVIIKRWLVMVVSLLVLALYDHDAEPLLPLVDPQLPPRLEQLELLTLKDLQIEYFVIIPIIMQHNVVITIFILLLLILKPIMR